MSQQVPKSFVVLAACFALAALASCSFERGKWTWTEDVKLADGTVLQVRQSRSYRSAGQWGKPGGMVKASTLEVIGPSIQTTIYNEGPEPLFMEHDPDTGALVFVAIVTNELVIPADMPGTTPFRPPYLQYRWDGTRWVREAVNPKFWGRSANLLLAISKLEDQNQYVSWEQKSEFNRTAIILHQMRVLDKDSYMGGP